MTGYCAVLRRSAEGCTLTFPDLPGCAAAGDSPDQLQMAAPGILKAHLQQLLLEGRPLPPPRPWRDVRAAHAGASDVIRVLPVLTQL